MKKSPLLALLSCAALLSACGNDVPACGDAETLALVQEIANEEMQAQIGKAQAQGFSYSVQYIRTTTVDKSTSARTCAAELHVQHHSGNSEVLPITYTVESTDDQRHFYVEVQGL